MIQNAFDFAEIRKAEQFLHFPRVMRNQEDTIGGYDIGLALLVVAAAWLLIFQSGLFGK